MIHFYDKNRNTVMILHDFSFENMGEPRISFLADISYVFYKASGCISDFKVDFDHFLDELKLLYDWKTKTAQFVPLERQLEIYFEQIEYGHILVSIKLNHFNIDHVIYESTLSIQYGIDQSFLPELIEELESMIISWTGNNLKI